MMKGRLQAQRLLQNIRSRKPKLVLIRQLLELGIRVVTVMVIQRVTMMSVMARDDNDGEADDGKADEDKPAVMEVLSLIQNLKGV